MTFSILRNKNGNFELIHTLMIMFKPIYYFLFCSLCASNILYGQLPQNCNTTDRILMMGDSWAQYMYDDNVHNQALDAYGHADKKIRSDVFEISLFSGDPNPQGSYYSVSGSEARQWRDEGTYAYLQNVRNQLIANPQIKLVIFSLGGNDVLAGQSDCGWYKNMDLDPDLPSSGCGFTNETEFFDKLESDVTWIINEVLAVRADIEVLISSYDYPNFNVTTGWAGCLWCDLCALYACPKRLDLSYDVDGNGSITGSELITDAEINQMMMGVEARRQAIANANPRIYFDNSMGLTHYTYGYAGAPAGASPYPGGPPNYTPGGDPNYPSNRDNFRLVSIPIWFDAPADPIHLSADAYSYKAKNQMDRVIFEQVRGLNDESNYLTVWSEGNNDGYVDILEHNVFNNGLRMGDEDTGFFGLDNDYRSILSFDTGAIPDNATITGASLYLIRSSVEDNPFLKTDRNPVLDIKNGFFGASSSLEVVDGTAAASATNVGCFIGDATENKNAIRVDVDANALQFVNTLGKTQFRLYFDYADWSDEYINFYDGAGNAGLVSPSEEAKNSRPVFQYVVKKKTPNGDGTYTEEILEQQNELQRRPGFVFKEHLVRSEEDEEGVILETMMLSLAVEHPGLAKYMADYQGAPANGYAPFLDVTYNVVLPIDLMEFEAKKVGKNAFLTWATASERNSDGFEVQHSSDGRNWVEVGWVTARGVSTESTYYDFLHQKTVPGVNYYRLKMIDESGDFEYSNMVHINIESPNDLIEVFPNPFTEQLHLRFNNHAGGSVDIQLTNILGKVLYTEKIEIPLGGHTFDIPTRGLSAGAYFVNVRMALGQSVVKVIREGN